MLPISIIIPTLNRPKMLAQTLDSWMSCEHFSSEIIVVDQTIDENLRADIEQVCQQYLCVNYFHLDEPSLTHARNVGISLSHNEILIFCDDDVLLPKNILKDVYDLFLENSNVNLIGGLDRKLDEVRNKSSVDFPNKKKNHFWGYFFCLRSFKKRKIGHVTPSMLGVFPEKVDAFTKTEWTMGFFFAVRKSFINRNGIRFDEKLKGYAFNEDLDFSYSCYKASVAEGAVCIFSKKIYCEHLASAEYRIPSKMQNLLYVRNRFYLSHKHQMGLISRIAIFWSCIGILLKKMIKKEHPEYLISAMMKTILHCRRYAKGKFEN